MDKSFIILFKEFIKYISYVHCKDYKKIYWAAYKYFFISMLQAQIHS